MENLTSADTVVVVIAALLAICSAITTIGNAIEKIVKARKAAMAPNNQQNARLDALEKWKEEVDQKLSNDKEQLDEIHDGLRASYQAQLALLDHGIDGNNIQQMQEAKTVLQKHLINR